MEIKDLTGFSEPVTKLIELIDKAFFGMFKPISTVINANTESYKIKKLADAKKYQIKVLTESSNDDQRELSVTSDDFELKLKGNSIEAIAIESLISREIKKQINLNSIVSKAIEFIKENEKVTDKPVDSDWINKFINESKEISNEEMQNLWAKILSDEVSRPNSYSLRTLETLKNMNKYDAEVFTKFIKLSFDNIDGRYILSDRNLYTKYGLDFSDITLLEEIGLLTRNIVRYIVPGDNRIVSENGYLININNISQTRMELNIYDTTTVGFELSRLIEKAHSDEYIKDFINSIKESLGSNVEVYSMKYRD